MVVGSNEISPDDAADFILCECRERGDVLTNLKLQKLLYYAQAWYLALEDKPLFSEDFQAWVHGPVLLSQYHRYKEHEWRPILSEIKKPELVNNKVVSHLIEVVDVFGAETGTALELMTHNEQPWKDARQGVPIDQQSNAVISKDSMTTFYRAINEQKRSKS